MAKNSNILKIFKALSDPKRLEILKMLRNKEMCGCEILEKFNVTQPTLSHDMKLLVDSHLVNVINKRKWKFYKLNYSTLELIKDYININFLFNKDKSIKIAFVCSQNSCRSQIAEYLAKKLNTNSLLQFYSFGTDIARSVNPKAIEVVKDLYNDDISCYEPKTINDIPNIDYYISMGCGVSCPNVKKEFYDNWNLKDPGDLNIEQFKLMVKEIEQKVKYLLATIKIND